MLTAWFALAWFLSRGAWSVRPTALQRHYTTLWLFVGAWIVLVGVTVLENNFGLAGPYFMVIYFGGVFLATLISYFELFALPRKTIFAEKYLGNDWDGARSIASRPLTRDSLLTPLEASSTRDRRALNVLRRQHGIFQVIVTAAPQSLFSLPPRHRRRHRRRRRLEPASIIVSNHGAICTLDLESIRILSMASHLLDNDCLCCSPQLLDHDAYHRASASKESDTLCGSKHHTGVARPSVLDEWLPSI